VRCLGFAWLLKRKPLASLGACGLPRPALRAGLTIAGPPKAGHSRLRRLCWAPAKTPAQHPYPSKKNRGFWGNLHLAPSFWAAFFLASGQGKRSKKLGAKWRLAAFLEKAGTTLVSVLGQNWPKTDRRRPLMTKRVIFGGGFVVQGSGMSFGREGPTAISLVDKLVKMRRGICSKKALKLETISQEVISPN